MQSLKTSEPVLFFDGKAGHHLAQQVIATARRRKLYRAEWGVSQDKARNST